MTFVSILTVKIAVLIYIPVSIALLVLLYRWGHVKIVQAIVLFVMLMGQIIVMLMAVFLVFHTPQLIRFALIASMVAVAAIIQT